jgi:SAM-dependent methyltransferase
MPLGSELRHSKNLSKAEKLYVRVFGAPINGLRIRARRALPLVRAKKGDEALDAGCGTGVFTFELARRMPDATIVGADIDREQLEDNRRVLGELGLKNVRFEEIDLTRLSDEDRFDWILSVDNLEHIEDDEDALRRFRRALKPGGRMVLHVPGYERRWLFFGWSVNFDVEGHFRPGYRIEELRAKLERAGFEIEELRATYGWIETITNNISYKITGARKRNKTLYALVFPVLNFLSWFGRNATPEKGAGALALARKSERRSEEEKENR